jgi:hypothetical protein
VGRVMAHGGEVVEVPYPEGNLWVATRRKIRGRLVGLSNGRCRRSEPVAAASGAPITTY